MNDNFKTKVYIDGANVFYAQKKMGWVLDWAKIKNYLTKNYSITEWWYYQGVKENDEKMGKYLKYLDKIGFRVITKPVKKIKIGKQNLFQQQENYGEIYKCNFDVEITADMIFDRQHIDLYILFSGDSDFDYVVKRLRDVGKKIIVYSSRKVLSWELKLAVNKYYFLEKERVKFAR